MNIDASEVTIAVGLLAVVVSAYSSWSSTRTAEATRLFVRRADAYAPIVEAVVELRDYARKAPPRAGTPPLPVPTLDDGRWLGLLAQVELLASSETRKAFEVIPGHVTQYRIALMEFEENLSASATAEERAETASFLKRSRSELVGQCDAVLDAVRKEVGTG